MLVFITSFSFAEDLLSGIEQSSEMGTDRKLNDIVLREDLKSEDFGQEDLQRALKDARILKLNQLQYKIQLLDKAHLLPKHRREKYANQQKELQGFRNELAHRMVESYTKQKSIKSQTIMGTVATEYLHLSAAKVLNTLTDEKRRDQFKSSWKASIVDRGARTSFGSMLAMINLYGIDHKLVKSFNSSLDAYRDSFKQSHAYYSNKIPKEERSDYVYKIFKNSNLILDKPLQSKLDKITLMENRLNQKKYSLKAKKLTLRKLQFEKETFLNLLKSNGLELSGKESFSIEKIEEIIEEWFEQNAIQPEELVWPFDEPGELLAPMNLPEKSHCSIRTVNRHLIKAPVDGKLIQNNSKRLLILSAQHWIMFEGSFKSSLAKTSKVTASELIAKNEPPYEVRISLQNTVKGKSWEDICKLR